MAIIYFISPYIEQLSTSLWNRSLSRNSTDKEQQPLHHTFYQYNHESAIAWLKWIDGQNSEMRETAYQMLDNYLNNSKDDELGGSITIDVLKVLPSFRRRECFDSIKSLMTRLREKWIQIKGVELIYREAAKSVVKIDPEEAIDLIVSELEATEEKKDLVLASKTLIKAAFKLKLNDKLTNALVDVVCNMETDLSVKQEIFEFFDTNEESRMMAYKKIIIKVSACGSLNDAYEKILEIVFFKIKNYLSGEEFNEEIWKLIMDISDIPNMRNLFIKFISEFLTYDENQLNYQQYLDLKNKQDPAKGNFREALASRHNINDRELEVLKIPLKEEELGFAETELLIEKAKKTRSILHELSDIYRDLESLLSQHEGGRQDKANSVISIILGDSINEKIYLLRALAANSNKAFIYVNLREAIRSIKVLVSFRQAINNNKPCIIYCDNLEETFLGTNFNEKEVENLLREHCTIFCISEITLQT